MAVVGHVEWVDFVAVTRYPPRGQVEDAKQVFTRAGGGGVVAADVLSGLTPETEFFCALGRDGNGEAAAAQLRERGVRLHVAWREQPTRRVITFLEDDGERTIVTIGDRLQPSGDDQLDWERFAGIDGVYFTAGDGASALRARRAGVLTASPRAHPGLDVDGLELDALIYSASDEHESQWAQRLESRTRLMVATQGAQGGRWWGESEGTWSTVPPPGEIRDDYGCGDSFAAGFTFGLAQGLPADRAAAIGAQCGACALTVAGAP
ncbi:MAG TPA: PfkB family carbohydrate kinase [Solirubrobacteraceae bacterium]|jgi:ribokinase